MRTLNNFKNERCLYLLKLLIRKILDKDNDSINNKLHAQRYNGIYEIIQKLSLIPENIIIDNIQRHRLLFFFSKNEFINELLPSVSKEIDLLFRKEICSCLNEASVTRELSLFLNEKGIKHIFLKGIPLSLQTTNSIIGRGASKDIDILIGAIKKVKVLFTVK